MHETAGPGENELLFKREAIFFVSACRRRWTSRSNRARDVMLVDLIISEWFVVISLRSCSVPARASSQTASFVHFHPLTALTIATPFYTVPCYEAIETAKRSEREQTTQKKGSLMNRFSISRCSDPNRLCHVPQPMFRPTQLSLPLGATTRESEIGEPGKGRKRADHHACESRY